MSLSSLYSHLLFFALFSSSLTCPLFFKFSSPCSCFLPSFIAYSVLSLFPFSLYFVLVISYLLFSVPVPSLVVFLSSSLLLFILLFSFSSSSLLLVLLLLSSSLTCPLFHPSFLFSSSLLLVLTPHLFLLSAHLLSWFSSSSLLFSLSSFLFSSHCYCLLTLFVLSSCFFFSFLCSSLLRLLFIFLSHGCYWTGGGTRVARL